MIFVIITRIPESYRPFFDDCRAAFSPFEKYFYKTEIFFLTFQDTSGIILLVHGGIAQLGERLNGIQEVSGSIPLISTRNIGKA